MIKTTYRILRNSSRLNFACQKITAKLERYRLFQSMYTLISQYKIKKYSDFPGEIVFVVTSLCNSDCIMCSHKSSRTRFPDAIKILPFDLFKKAVDEIAFSKCEQVTFTGGEPMLDPHIFERIAYARAKLPKASMHLFTNGSLLHINNNMEKLISSRLDSITISVDATSEEEYEKVRKNLSYKQLISNIKTLHAFKKSSGKGPLIRLSMLLLQANRKSHDEYINAMRGMADIVELNSPHNMGGTVNVETRDILKFSKRYPCKYLWTRMTIPPDGNISVCGFDQFVKTNIIGNIHDYSLKELWKHEAMEAARNYHLEGKYTAIDICSNCTSHISWLKGFFT